MTFAPLPNALHMIRVTEVIPVAILAQPAALTLGFASPATIGGRAEELVVRVPVIRCEELPAAPAFATNYFAAHLEPRTEKSK